MDQVGTALLLDCGDTSPLWLHGGKAGKVLHVERFLHLVTCRKSGVMPPQSKQTKYSLTRFNRTCRRLRAIQIMDFLIRAG